MRAHLVSGVSTTIPDQIGIQISWFFKERRKPRYLLKKDSQSKGENWQQSQHCVTRDSNPGYTGGKRVALATSLPLPSLLLNFVLS